MKLPEFLLRLGYTAKAAAQAGMRPLLLRASSTQNLDQFSLVMGLDIPPGYVALICNIASSLSTATNYPRHCGWGINRIGEGGANMYPIAGREWSQTGFAAAFGYEQMHGWEGELMIPYYAGAQAFELRTYALFQAATVTNTIKTGVIGFYIPTPSWLSAA